MDSARSLLFPSVTSIDSATRTLDAFLSELRPDLERALVARFGLHDGMDAAAEALAYGCAEWERLAAMSNPAGYLYRVGESKGRRWQGRRRRTVLLVEEPTSVDRPVDIDLQRALSRLKSDQRVAIVLVHAHGHTYATAAEVMDVPITTVTNHIHRGLARLRRLLEDT
jgi:DNA-directed RNA polymerase specialized sigma24 family protein